MQLSCKVMPAVFERCARNAVFSKVLIGLSKDDRPVCLFLGLGQIILCDWLTDADDCSDWKGLATFWGIPIQA